MRRKFLTANTGIAALILTVLSLCLAACIVFALPRVSYADDEGGTGTTETEDKTGPGIESWDWGSFDESVNFISIPDRLSDMEMSFRIYQIKDALVDFGTTEDYIEWLHFTEVVDGEEIDRGESFTLVDGAMPDYVAAKLKTLDNGRYCLVTVADTGYTTEFEVYLVRNTIISLTLEQWTWREFSEIKNVISINIAHGFDYEGNYDTDKSATIDGITYTVCSDDSGKCGAEYSELLMDFRVESDGKVKGTEQREAFKNLSAGKYWLVACTNDNNKNVLDTRQQIQFTVAKSSNPWTTTPSILQWTWGEYDSNINLINGASRHGTVEFGVYSDAGCTKSVIPSFTFDNGNVSEEIAKALSELHVGTYYLEGLAPSTDNYDECSGIIPFTVQKAQNNWTVSPYVISWKYGQYDKNFNVIKGEAKFASATAFSIYKDAECTDAVEFAQEIGGSNKVFVLGSDGLVPDYVKDVLSSLGKGSYYLLAVIDGTSDYSGINDGEDRKPVPFEVTALDNYWTEVPGMMSWNEGHFSAFDIDKHLTGKAKIGDVKFTVKGEGDTVLFTILTQNGSIVSVQSGNGEPAKVSDLNSLSVGTYELFAEVEGNENYTALSCKAMFAVSEDSVALTGIIATVITFAVLDVAAAGVCVALIIIRRRKVQEQLRKMVRKDTGRG